MAGISFATKIALELLPRRGAKKKEIFKWIIKMIIERHGSDKMEKMLNKADKCGETGLFAAATKGHLQVVQYLVNIKETDVNMPNKGEMHMSPLHVANENLEIKMRARGYVKISFFSGPHDIIVSAVIFTGEACQKLYLCLVQFL